MTAYTKEDRKYLEAMVIKAEPDIPCKDTPDPGLESILLNKCTEFLRDHHYKFFHDYSKKINEAGILDLYIFLPKRRLVVMELKAKGGRLSKEQKEWISYLSFHGYEVYRDVRSYKRFIKLIYNKETP